MTKTSNVLQVLRLFSDERQHVRVAEIASLLSVSSATAYRYVSELEQAGLVEASSVGRYVPGPAIVELDRQIRVHDPLIAAAADIMKALSDRTGGTTILARLHGLRVVCVDQVRGRHGPPSVSYERGRAMPLYRGATSTAILAHLDGETLRAVTAHDAAALDVAGLPSTAGALMRHFEGIRAQGFAHSDSAVDAETLGWGAPIRHGKHLLGSLSVVLSRRTPDVSPRHVADQLKRAAWRVQARMDVGQAHS
jgi:DNA-binding IclR family transcriptional regulator